MSSDSQFQNNNFLLRQYQILLAISEAIAAQRDFPSLFRKLSHQLSKVTDFDGSAVMLYNDKRDVIRMYPLETDVERIVQLPNEMPATGTPGGWVCQNQQPMLVTDVSREERFPEMNHPVAFNGAKSYCLLPLTSAGRCLGALGFFSLKERAWSEDDLEFLGQVARQIAPAVDNAINFENALAAEQELRLLLDVNNSVISHLDLRELFKAIAVCLRRVIPHDAAGLNLFDADSNQLRVLALDSQLGGKGPFTPGGLFPIEETPGGIAFTERRTVLVSRSDLEKFSSPHIRYLVANGVRSGVIAPLILHGRVLGTLGLASLKDDAFTEKDAETIMQIAGQIAVAVENAINFEKARSAQQQYARERDRSQLMLEINNAVVSQLSLRELVRVISSSIREAMNYDTASVALYDPETNQLRAYMFDHPTNMPAVEEGTLIPLQGTIGGRAFISGQPVFMRSTDNVKAPTDFDRRLIEAGIKSGGCVPLVAHDRKLGVLGVGSFREDAFSEADQELLCHIANQIAIAVENALAYREIETLKNKLAEEKLYLEEEIHTVYNFEEIIGNSPALKRILKQVETVAPTDSTVLIQGETGTGKELIARAIHSLSRRRERTLVKLNCAAIPMGLIESELFGHEKGSFTGAIAQRIGRFELADKGTMFLDEVGEIPLELQPKLLRVLQEREFERLGNARTLRTDVRLIAATNRDLAQMAAENRFRSDLYYRLNVFPITIPPLRERREDIPMLLRFFANKFAGLMKKQIKTIPADAVAALQNYRWPGNIRELENMVERAVILTQGEELQIPLSEIDVPAKPTVAAPHSTPSSASSASSAAPAAPKPTDSSSLEAVEREHILRILRDANWVVGGPSGAAARLGMKRTTLQNRIRKLGITRQS